MEQVERDEEVRRLAYQLWELEGRPAGREHEFWARAAREIEGDLEERHSPERHIAR